LRVHAVLYLACVYGQHLFHARFERQYERPNCLWRRFGFIYTLLSLF